MDLLALGSAGLWADGQADAFLLAFFALRLRGQVGFIGPLERRTRSSFAETRESTASRADADSAASSDCWRTPSRSRSLRMGSFELILDDSSFA